VGEIGTACRSEAQDRNLDVSGVCASVLQVCDFNKAPCMATNTPKANTLLPYTNIDLPFTLQPPHPAAAALALVLDSKVGGC
jgi:hypothetical protein